MTDANQAEAQSFTFKAETKQLLNILIHSLYKDRLMMKSTVLLSLRLICSSSRPALTCFILPS